MSSFLAEAVSEALEQPPLQFLFPHLQPGVFTGFGELPGFSWSPINWIYGIVVTCQAVPAELGRTSQTPAVYDLPLITFCFHSFLGNGAAIIAERREQHTVDFLYQFINSGGPRVTYDCLPGVSFAFAYLRGS